MLIQIITHPTMAWTPKLKTLERFFEGRIKTAVHILCDFMHERNPEQDVIDLKHITIYEYQQRLGNKLSSFGDPESKQKRAITKSKPNEKYVKKPIVDQ